MKMFLLIALLALSTASYASDRQDDLVQIKLGSFVYEEFSLCKLNVPQPRNSGEFQMRISAVAPAKGVLSRDYFIAYVASATTMIQAGMALSAGARIDQISETLTCDEIDEPIGKVDLELNIRMTKDGIQIETVDGSTGKATRRTNKWEE